MMSTNMDNTVLYTAVTRARKTAIIVGDKGAIGECAWQCQVDDRKTFLSIFLRNPFWKEEELACAEA